jgi:hypothetical protein
VLVGVKVTLTVQDALGAIAAAQELFSANWPLSVPVSDTPLTVRFAVPVLVIVTDRVALVVLISWLSKEIVVEDKLIAGVTPVPVSGTFVGLPEALCAIAKVALFAPVVVGVNVTLTVQVALGVSDVPQVVDLAYWLAFVPVKVIAAKPPVEENTRSSVPVLLTVIVWAPLATLIS